MGFGLFFIFHSLTHSKCWASWLPLWLWVKSCRFQGVPVVFWPPVAWSVLQYFTQGWQCPEGSMGLCGSATSVLNLAKAQLKGAQRVWVMPPSTAALVALPRVLQLGVSHLDALRAPAHGESPAHQAPAQPTVRSTMVLNALDGLRYSAGKLNLSYEVTVTAFNLQKCHFRWVLWMQSKFQLWDREKFLRVGDINSAIPL